MYKLYYILFMLLITDVSLASVWNQKSQIPAVGRHRATGVAIDDKGYIGLGHMNGTGVNIVYQDWWEFDPATNSWTQKMDFPVPNYGALSFAVENKVYIGGGTGLGSEFYCFNPLTNVWTQIANALSTNATDDTAFGIGNKGYIKDGNIFLEYDPSTDSWSNKANCPVLGWSITSFVIQDKGYVKSGLSIYEYKPSVNQWTARANFPGLTENGGPGFSVDDKGYIITGYSGGLSNVNSEMWEYNPAVNQWSQLDDFPGTSRRFSSAFAINNKGYIGTGTNGTNMNDFWEFNPALKGVGLDESNAHEISVYPNPATDLMTFDMTSYSNKSNLKLIVYSVSGQLILEQKIMSNKIQLFKSQLNNGFYIYTITSNQELLTKGKIIFK